MSYAYFVIMMRMTKWRNMAFDKKKNKAKQELQIRKLWSDRSSPV